MIDGILIVDKDKNMTSHDVVAKVRRRFDIKKVGHAGTLDPNATGVLVLLLGKATKLSNSFLNEEKEYSAIMKLGERTDSGDCEGKIIARKSIISDSTGIESVVAGIKGEIDQMPPMFSAKKINGKRLYKLARKGIQVERARVRVTIKDIRVLKVELPLVVFDTICSKGTYIRQLADDIGEKLGCGAHLTELRRMRSGTFSLENAVTILDIDKMTQEDLNESIIRI